MRSGETARTWRLLRLLRTGARRPSAELVALQERCLREAVAHAYETIPFYRRLWDEHGVSPASVRGLGDLARLPVVRGSTVREAAGSGSLVSRAVCTDGLPRFFTSGSTGSPLAVPRGRVEQRLWRAFGLRIWLEHGARWRDLTICFDAQAGPPHPLQRLGLSRTAWVSTELPPEEWLARYRTARAAIVVATATSLRKLCDRLGAAGGHLPAPRIVFAQGELVDAATRRLAQGALGVDPASLYGLTELGYVAWQCERREGFHVNAEGCIAEVLRGDGPAAPGEIGMLVVTDLRGRTMPLLRYDTGDLAVAGGGPCPCGRSLPVVASIEGRAVDALALDRGRVVTPRAVLDGLAGVASPDAYRLHQEAIGRFRLSLERPASREAIRSALRGMLGDVELVIEAGVPPPRPAGAEKTTAVTSALGFPGRSVLG